MIQEGIEWNEEIIVTDKDSAINMKSGTLQVYSTPAMIALMEYTAWKGLEKYLEPGQTTVGVHMKVDHVKATAIGKKVQGTSILKQVDGRKLTFAIEVHDEQGLIGTAEHVRVIVDEKRFMDKVSQ